MLAESHPSAFVCMNDRIAFGVYQAIAEAGLRVPADVSVVSFDDDELATSMRPGLTTVAIPHEQMGALAVDAITSRADGTAEFSFRCPYKNAGRSAVLHRCRRDEPLRQRSGRSDALSNQLPSPTSDRRWPTCG